MSRFFTAVFFFALACSLASSAKAVTEQETDLLIVGATESGWAAAMQAARGGVRSITIVHDGRWYGGQFTEQALACVDENKGIGKVGWGVDWHPMKRSFHRFGLFKEWTDRMEAFNTEKYGSPMPGKPYHGPSTFRPAEAEAIFREMIQPHVDAGTIRVFWNRYPVRSDTTESPGKATKLTGVWFAPLDKDEADLHIRARITIDASDWGDVVQLSGAAYECGPDLRETYGEPSAPVDHSHNPPSELNPITWAMIVEESDGETPIARPEHFDDRNYPRATHLSLGEFRDLKWDVANPGLGAILHWPDAGAASHRQLSVYTVRRIVDGYESRDGKTSILLNYMNGQDYPLERLPQRVVEKLEKTEAGASEKNLVQMTRAQREIVFQDARQHSLGVLYHLQNFVHERAGDKTNSFRKFHLSNEFGTPDRLPPKPYIRESLRLKAMYMMREQDGRNRDGKTKQYAKERFAEVMYPDALFAWQFHYDFHRTGRTYLKSEGNSGPWIDYHKPNRHTSFVSDRSVFPLRSLIPAETDGLLGAQGNVGFSSIVSAAIRLHDQRMHIGQAAGATAAVALQHEQPLQELPHDRAALEEIREKLCGDSNAGADILIWPYRDLKPGDDCFVAVNRLAALGVLTPGKQDVEFLGTTAVTLDWVDANIDAERMTPAARELSQSICGSLAETRFTRGEFCVKIWRRLSDDGFGSFAFHRETPNDADGDAIPDIDDPLPFTPNESGRFELYRVKLMETNDGVPPASKVDTDSVRFINFCGKSDGLPGMMHDHGLPFDRKRGFGWSRYLSANHRRRKVFDGPRDTFIFTRQKDTWECDLPNGRYRVTVCVGDSAYEQFKQMIAVQGSPLIKPSSTEPGRFSEASVDVHVTDGGLTIEIGSGEEGSNTCLNWLMIEPLQPSADR